MAQRRGRTQPPCAGARHRATTPAKPAASCRRLQLRAPQLVPLDDASARMALAALEDLLIANRARNAADTTGES